MVPTNHVPSRGNTHEVNTRWSSVNGAQPSIHRAGEEKKDRCAASPTIDSLPPPFQRAEPTHQKPRSAGNWAKPGRPRYMNGMSDSLRALASPSEPHGARASGREAAETLFLEAKEREEVCRALDA